MHNALPASPPAAVHHGRLGAVLRLSLTNFGLNLLTMSLWRFWGKAQTRRLLWSQTTLWGEPLEYTGTGKELFLGFLLVVGVVLLPLFGTLAVLNAAVAAGNPLALIGSFAVQMLMLFLAGAGLYRARRYQLSRTVWRGIRGGLNGQAWRYGLMFVFTLVSAGLTLGWSLPATENWLERYKLDNTTFGDHRFECDSKARPLYRQFFYSWLLACGLVLATVIILALIGVVVQEFVAPDIFNVAMGALSMVAVTLVLVIPFVRYRVAFWRNLAAGTRFAGTSFGFTPAASGLFWLGLGNWLLVVLSLGILRPVAAWRTFRFACRHLSVDGEPDFGTISQGTAAAGRTGEGLAAVFDGGGAF